MVSHGLAKESPEQFQLFFGTGDCQRLNAPCEGPEYRYYEVGKGLVHESSACCSAHVTCPT